MASIWRTKGSSAPHVYSCIAACFKANMLVKIDETKGREEVKKNLGSRRHTRDLELCFGFLSNVNLFQSNSGCVTQLLYLRREITVSNYLSVQVLEKLIFEKKNAYLPNSGLARYRVPDFHNKNIEYFHYRGWHDDNNRNSAHIAHVI